MDRTLGLQISTQPGTAYEGLIEIVDLPNRRHAQIRCLYVLPSNLADGFVRMTDHFTNEVILELRIQGCTESDWDDFSSAQSAVAAFLCKFFEQVHAMPRKRGHGVRKLYESTPGEGVLKELQRFMKPMPNPLNN